MNKWAESSLFQRMSKWEEIKGRDDEWRLTACVLHPKEQRPVCLLLFSDLWPCKVPQQLHLSPTKQAKENKAHQVERTGLSTTLGLNCY